ncbi:MAG: hypothetical protein J1E34_10075 [Oscillospiraceae bacterium]|nr:hypothetical protein [Oscillospiraceae bacterium]
MTITQVIQNVEQMRSPTGEAELLISFINDLEWRIKREIIDNSEDGDGYPFFGYSSENDMNTELLAPPPYDEVYVQYCCYKMDLRENQIANANNSLERFENILDNLSRYWIRTHFPKQRSLLKSDIYGI